MSHKLVDYTGIKLSVLAKTCLTVKKVECLKQAQKLLNILAWYVSQNTLAFEFLIGNLFTHFYDE